MGHSFIPSGRQSINQEDIDSICAILRSNWLTQGPAIERFENAIAEYCGAKYAVAVFNGTMALHIACLTAGLGESDILWTSPNTFVASANCGLYCGAQVDFVDIDSKSYNVRISELEKKLEQAKKENKLPKVFIPVHFAGQSCEMKDIRKLSQDYGFQVIEDACHGIGGEYKGDKLGSCRFSDMTVFSFHPVKIITTGEGGMVLTNSDKFYKKLTQFRSHGIIRDPDLMEGETHGPWYYQQLELGYNARITDIQAALGYSQLQRIDDFVKRRLELVGQYNEGFKNLPITLPWQHPDTYSAFHLYVIRLKLKEISKNHRQVFEELLAAEIGVNLHYIPVHTQPYYQKLGFNEGDYPEAESYYKEAISLPLFYELSDEQQGYIIKTLKGILEI